MMLTDIKIRALKPRDAAYKESDKDGLYLSVLPTGVKVWRHDYRFDGKRKTHTFGRYPDLSLAEARSALSDFKAGLRQSVILPTPKVEAASARDTFKEVGEDYLKWLRAKQPPLAERTISKKVWIIDDIAGPVLNDKRMRDIVPLDILGILESLQAKGQLETAKRTRSLISTMFRYAAWGGKADIDPVPTLMGAVPPPVHKHHAAIINEGDFGTLLTVIRDYSGWYGVRLSLLFIAYTFCRPGEARLATWDEFDLTDKVWTIPPERMKMRREHKVPLSAQALKILKEARATDPYSPLVFPSIRSNRKPLSDNALNASLRRMGYTGDEMVAHGFRSSASTILNDRGHDSETIEIQLSHMSADRIKRIYDRGDRWDKRVELMKAWGRICDSLSIT